MNSQPPLARPLPRLAHAMAVPKSLGELPRITVVSRDEVLIDRIQTLASRRGAQVHLVSHSLDTARALERCELVVIDVVARDLAPASLGCSASLIPNIDANALLLVACQGGGEGPHARQVKVMAYPRHALALLLEELASSLPRPEGVADAASRILGHTPAIVLLREQIRNVARFREVSVLAVGETGTGKELVAEAIHKLGCSADRPFVAINCAAIPEHLFESELFGHEAGAYTGARGARPGLFETAAGGTVFLDEVAEMPAVLQPKLLRALESRRFRRVGANRDMPLRARVVSATNRVVLDPKGNGLRPDLYYRLAGFTLSLPALRERTPDIDVLAEAFLSAFRERHGTGPTSFSRRALEMLHAHAWPGNIRELRLVVEHAAIVARDSIVTGADVSLALHHQPARRPASLPPDAQNGRGAVDVPQGGLRDLERNVILRAFAENGRNVSRTARRLGIPRTTLRARLRRYGAN